MAMYYLYIGILLIAIVRAQDHVVRLSNVGESMGRVEVSNNGVWGTVCREGWDFYDALVTCRQLGFPWIASRGWEHEAGSGTGPVWLSNVGCLGSETGLEQCSNDGWMEHECNGESGAAAVMCLRSFENATSSHIARLELMDGSGTIEAEGQIMIDLNTGERGVRFVIHDQGWDLADADVICRQMGHHSAVRATTNSYFGMNREGDSWIATKISYLATEFACTGTENHILECPFEGLLREDYPRGHDAGVICNRVQEPDGFQIRLVNGTNAHEGRLEVFNNGSWGSVCKRDKLDYEITSLDTNVICGQLGLGYGKEAPIDGRFGRSSFPVAVSGEFLCDGSELSLAQCYQFKFRDPQNCAEKEDSYDVSVICSGPIPETRSPIRFASDNFEDLGHVLIYHDGRWGTICDKGWTEANSEVVCRELGLGPPEQTLFKSIDVGGPIFLGGVTCKGDEATLDQCELGEWSEHSCTHSMDVATVCSNGGVPRLPASTVTLIVASLTTLYCSM